MLVSLVGPFFTMITVSIPQLACRSKWQCINQTPANHRSPYIYLSQSIYIYMKLREREIEYQDWQLRI
jgi:hypothetical protein